MTIDTAKLREEIHIRDKERTILQLCDELDKAIAMLKIETRRRQDGQELRRQIIDELDEAQSLLHLALRAHNNNVSLSYEEASSIRKYLYHTIVKGTK